MFTQSKCFRVSVILNEMKDDKILWANCDIIS